MINTFQTMWFFATGLFLTMPMVFPETTPVALTIAISMLIFTCLTKLIGILVFWYYARLHKDPTPFRDFCRGVASRHNTLDDFAEVICIVSLVVLLARNHHMALAIIYPALSFTLYFHYCIAVEYGRQLLRHSK